MADPRPCGVVVTRSKPGSRAGSICCIPHSTPPAPNCPASPALLSSPWAGWEQTWCRQRTCSCPCWSRHPRRRPGTPGGREHQRKHSPPTPRRYRPGMLTPQEEAVWVRWGDLGGRTHILGGASLDCFHGPIFTHPWSSQTGLLNSFQILIHPSPHPPCSLQYQHPLSHLYLI